MWFLATESPMKFIFLPRTSSRKALGLNLGSSHPSGFHLQSKKSVFGLPCFKQFFESGIVGQVEFEYSDPLSSRIHCPLDKSQSLKSKTTTTINNTTICSMCQSFRYPTKVYIHHQSHALISK